MLNFNILKQQNCIAFKIVTLQKNVNIRTYFESGLNPERILFGKPVRFESIERDAFINYLYFVVVNVDGVVVVVVFFWLDTHA